MINNGEIKVGNSSDASNPSIGIYNNILGSTIQNNGVLTLGTNSLGIFDKGGSVTENGTLNVGSMSTATGNSIANNTWTFSVKEEDVRTAALFLPSQMHGKEVHVMVQTATILRRGLHEIHPLNDRLRYLQDGMWAIRQLIYIKPYHPGWKS